MMRLSSFTILVPSVHQAAFFDKIAIAHKYSYILCTLNYLVAYVRVVASIHRWLCRFRSNVYMYK